MRFLAFAMLVAALVFAAPASAVTAYVDDGGGGGGPVMCYSATIGWTTLMLYPPAGSPGPGYYMCWHRSFANVTFSNAFLSWVECAYPPVYGCLAGLYDVDLYVKLSW